MKKGGGDFMSPGQYKIYRPLCSSYYKINYLFEDCDNICTFNYKICMSMTFFKYKE